ncbi:helix-turn-helix domain-containing protein [Aurantimonas endophytica]|uniref:AraC-like DNA-binding protein n=1 Tax=Aurantimonas endophytica TaxID=1522175 RepID=A0A7W6HHT8_9HYPH|nr:AraC family transcriptional regulator [Aurantimonas endophytica]MBB4005173.1 AraC-like DNA-binding protein [Aurantimonas endophytica]MCO6406164.1 helix-turn-helix domain-containing protein [Aurantimonas endophytica]
MPSIPLPFVISLVLCLLLVRMGRQDDGRLGLFPLLVGAFALQAALSGLNWSLGWHPVRLVQPILAAVLPALAFVAFDHLRRSGKPDPARLWPHLAPALLVSVLIVIRREPIDLVLFAVYLGYGIALLRMSRAGPGALVAARIGDENVAHRALVALGSLLIATAFIDAAVSLDLAFGGGRLAGTILTVSGVLWLAAAGYAATAAEGSRPASEPDGIQDVPASPTATIDGGIDAGPPPEDAAIVARIDRLMREHHLYRDPDLTLERLARRAGTPARQISAALNRIHGRNVSQIVNEYRVAEARKRLVETREPVTTVMLESGFGTKSNFNREFLRVTGMSPSAYRQSNGSIPGEATSAPGRGSTAAAS